MEAVYPAAASALARGRRRRRPEPRLRHRTAPVTFAEIKEVDEEQDLCEESDVSAPNERRRRPDELLELSREFAEFRRRRARRTALREPDEVTVDASSASANASTSHVTHAVTTIDKSREVSEAPKAHAQLTRASSEPT